METLKIKKNWIQESGCTPSEDAQKWCKSKDAKVVDLNHDYTYFREKDGRFHWYLIQKVEVKKGL